MRHKINAFPAILAGRPLSCCPTEYLQIFEHNLVFFKKKIEKAQTSAFALVKTLQFLLKRV